jgi:5-oxoprolinase (ATP-hydrolysing) subunit A
MIKVNCDIGERGADHEIDLQLMNHIQIANIACGGHAGDEKSIAVFRHLADKNGVEIAGHLGYPDKENFGRVSLDLNEDVLRESLDEQYSMLPDIKLIKFHGALYNDSCAISELAAILADWLCEKGINRIITGFESELARACSTQSIQILREAFAERRYAYSSQTGQLSLVKRTRSEACITDCNEAIDQTLSIVQKQMVSAFVDIESDQNQKRLVPLVADTICIHSDSIISLELAKSMAKHLSSLNV